LISGLDRAPTQAKRKHKKKKATVTVCLNGQTLVVPKSALVSLLSQGATFGVCPPAPPSPPPPLPRCTACGLGQPCQASNCVCTDLKDGGGQCCADMSAGVVPPCGPAPTYDCPLGRICVDSVPGLGCRPVCS
jgi:hypothetical protein